MGIYNKIISKKTSNILYHYTSQRGFLEIVKNRSIWATDIDYLNDSEEVNNGITLVREAFKKRNEKFPHEIKIINKFSDHFESGLENFLVYCVLSFSEEGDLLSQWRGYCPDFSGYSIGFDPEYIDTLGKDVGFSLVKCIYERSEQEDIIKTLIEESIEEYQKPADGCANMAVEKFFDKF